MPDNVHPSDDPLVAADVIGSTAYQRVKLTDATDGSEAPIGVDANPLVGRDPTVYHLLLDGATTTGPGSSFGVDGGVATHAMQVTWTGSPDFVNVALEGTITDDEDSWQFLCGINSNDWNSGGITAVGGPPLRRVRAEVYSLDGGASPTVSVHYLGSMTGGTISAPPWNPANVRLDTSETVPVLVTGVSTLKIIQSSGTVDYGVDTPAAADNPVPVHQSSARKTLLDAVTATGAGTATRMDYWGTAHAAHYPNHALQVVHTGSPTGVVVTLQGTIVGDSPTSASNWVTVGTWDSASQANGDIVWISGKPVTFLRANLTLTGGSSPTVTAYWVGHG